MKSKTIKLLAIDDNRDNLTVLKALISEAFPDAEYISAGSGLTGYDLCLSERPDVILLDIVMPDMDGYEVCRKIKNHEKLAGIPVIMLTANQANREGRIKALEAGADAFLSKPVDESELKAQIRAMLRIKESEDQKKHQKQLLENMVLDRTEALETELADRKKAERKLILSLDKLNRNKMAVLNLMEDLNSEIRERKRVEENLETERNLLRTLIDNLPDTIYILDREGRKVVANRADLKNIGFKNEAEVIGKCDLELFPGEIGKRGHTDNLTVIGTATPIIDVEEYFYDQNGKKTWLLTSKYPLYDSKGHVNGLFGTGHDITERKMMQEKIIESEAYYRTLVDLSPDGIIISDLDGKLTYGSVKAFEILNIPPGTELVGTSVLDYVDPSFHRNVVERITDILTGNVAPEIKEYLLVRSDKSPFWCELSSCPLPGKNGTPAGLLIVCRDISQRKKAEEELIRAKDKAEENDKLKTAFLHNISHEIRTPMNAIIGFSTMLADPELTGEDRNSFMEIIMNSCSHLLSIVSDIIEISNIEAGILRYNGETVNLNSQMNNFYKQFYPKISEKEIKFRFETSLSDEDSKIETDLPKLVVVITNLLNNAIKFTLRGRIEFGYKVKNGFLEFFVSDTGIGIPEDQLLMIFERFYQVEHTVSRTYEGTGLGLSICRAYVEFLGGTIRVESKQGEGSVFKFSIPYKPGNSINRNVKETDPDRLVSVKKEITILIAEDEDNNFRLMVEMLSGLKLKIMRAFNGREAVDLCQSGERIDLVFMDIKMPVMDGYEATRVIKNIKSGLPVIAQTAYAFESDREKAFDAGCDDYMTKPIRKEIIVSMVKRYAGITDDNIKN